MCIIEENMRKENKRKSEQYINTSEKLKMEAKND